MTEKKRTQARTVVVKSIKTCDVPLPLEELIHLRDLFNVRLPTNMHTTISQMLSKIEGREVIESRLWDKVVNACVKNNIPTESAAPDHVVALSAPPELGVFAVDIKEDYVVEERDEDGTVIKTGLTIDDLENCAEQKQKTRKKKK